MVDFCVQIIGIDVRGHADLLDLDGPLFLLRFLLLAGCSLYRHSGRLRKAPPRTRKLFLLAQIGAATLLVVSGFYAMLPLLEAVLSCIALLCAIAGLNIFLN